MIVCRDAIEDEAIRSIERIQVKIRGKRAGFTEYQVHLASILRGADIGKSGTEQDVVEPVAVDVASGTDSVSQTVVVVQASHGKTIATRERIKIHFRRKPRLAPENNIRLPAQCPTRQGSDDQIGNTVSVEFTRCDRKAGPFVGVHAAEHEAVRSVDRREFEIGREATGFSVNDIDCAGIGIGNINAIRPDKYIVIAVAVQVAGVADPITSHIRRTLAIECKTVVAIESSYV